jgi:hypothetical protein
LNLVKLNQHTKIEREEMARTKNETLESMSLATELPSEYRQTDKLLNRLDSYSTLKHRTTQWLDWAESGGIDLAKRDNKKLSKSLNDCGSYLIFRHFKKSQTSHLIGSCSCKEHLLCAFCASRRGVKNSVAYKEKVDELQSKNSNLKLYFVTYTVKNGENLHERFTHLKNSMQALIQRRRDFIKRPTVRHCEFAKFQGGVMSYEFKRGSGENKWHPHIHMLVLVDLRQFINHNELKREWLEITGDSHVVNIQAVASKAAYLEVFAYALKFSEMEHSDRWHAFKTLKGKRLIVSFGELRGVELPESLDDDNLPVDDEWYDELYRWERGRGYSSARLLLNSSDAKSIKTINEGLAIPRLERLQNVIKCDFGA